MRTYIQTGNVIFQSRKGTAQSLTKEIADLDAVLGDARIYADNPTRAQQAAQQRGLIGKRLADAEESWLAATEAYEQAAAATEPA